MKKRTRNKELTTFTRILLLIALYFLGGLVGKTTTFLSGSVALVWPPAGIAVAAILLFGYRFWPAWPWEQSFSRSRMECHLDSSRSARL